MKGCRGEKHKRAKLTEANVRYIRSSPLDGVLLGAELGVSPVTINRIKRRKRWKHI